VTPEQFYTELARRADSSEIPAGTRAAMRWCVVSVLQTRGSTPRKSGAQMAVALGADNALTLPLASIGGGAGEAKVFAAAHALLRSASAQAANLMIDLSGDAGETDTAISGVCGGQMHLLLALFSPTELVQRARTIANTLRAGCPVSLCARSLLFATPSTTEALLLQPMPMCLIGGGGHCGVALAELLVRLGFPVAVIDAREAVFGCSHAPELGVREFKDWTTALQNTQSYQAQGAPAAMVVLLSRSLNDDLFAIRAMADCPNPYALIGMMGSARRIRFVRDALAGNIQDAFLHRIKAPVGLDIGAQTPNEIAVSIAAELLSVRAAG
jgi:xanthine dehydrogenase accessory factor